MTDGLALTIVPYAAVLAGWAGACGLRGRTPSQGLVGAAIVLELALALQVLLRAVAWVAGDHPDEPGVVVGYLLVSLALLPVAGGLAGAASDPGSDRPEVSLTLAVACVMLVVVTTRLRLTWG